MRHHAPLTAIVSSISLASVFQAAASRAWAKTRPTRAYHRTGASALSKIHTAYGHHRVGSELGEPSSSSTTTPSVAPSLRAGAQFHITPFHLPVVLPTASPSENDTAENRVHDGDALLLSRTLTPQGVTSPTACGSSISTSVGHPTYECDPPWCDTQNSVPQQEHSRDTPRPLPNSNDRVVLPNAVTPDDLYQNMVRGITSGASLSALLEYHEAYAALHSTASFNIAIRYAIRQASFGTAADMLGRMVQEGVAGNEETRALRVRGLVRSGRWNQAWNEELEKTQQHGQGIPLPVWLELFGAVKRGAIMDHSYVRARGEAVRLQTPAPSVTRERLKALLEHPPLITVGSEGERVPPHVVHAIVRAFLLSGHQRTAAMKITTQYLETLPSRLDEDLQDGCLAIIHLHMALGRSRKLSEHFTALRTLFALLDMHQDLAPTSTTLFFLLQTLGGAKDCGRRADRLVRSFERRWGPDMIDAKVCRRWGSLWLKQGNGERADAVLASAKMMAEEEIDGEKEDGDLESSLRWLDEYRGRHEERERWHWRLIRRRLWRKRVRE